MSRRSPRSKRAAEEPPRGGPAGQYDRHVVPPGTDRRRPLLYTCCSISPWSADVRTFQVVDHQTPRRAPGRQRGKLFAKLVTGIEVAARTAGVTRMESRPWPGDRQGQGRLDAARQHRSCRQAGDRRGRGAVYEEFWYEGYAPGGLPSTSRSSPTTATGPRAMCVRRSPATRQPRRTGIGRVPLRAEGLPVGGRRRGRR